MRVPSTALSLLLPAKRSSSTDWRWHRKLPLILVPESRRSGCRMTIPVAADKDGVRGCCQSRVSVSVMNC